VASEHTQDWLGPVDLLVIGFPDGNLASGGFEQLASLVNSGTVRVLDFEFVRKSASGAEVVEVEDLHKVEGFDAGFWVGASSHLLGADDLDELAAELGDGELALVLLIEQQWLAGLVDTWVAGGARVVAEGGVPAQELLDALDAAEQREDGA